MRFPILSTKKFFILSIFAEGDKINVQSQKDCNVSSVSLENSLLYDEGKHTFVACTLRNATCDIMSLCLFPDCNLRHIRVIFATLFKIEISVTRLGYLWNNLETNSLTKLAQILSNFLFYFKNISFYVKIALTPFGTTLVKIKLLLILASGHTDWHCANFVGPEKKFPADILEEKFI